LCEDVVDGRCEKTWWVLCEDVVGGRCVKMWWVGVV